MRRLAVHALRLGFGALLGGLVFLLLGFLLALLERLLGGELLLFLLSRLRSRLARARPCRRRLEPGHLRAGGRVVAVLNLAVLVDPSIRLRADRARKEDRDRGCKKSVHRTINAPESLSDDRV